MLQTIKVNNNTKKHTFFEGFLELFCNRNHVTCFLVPFLSTQFYCFDESLHPCFEIEIVVDLNTNLEFSICIGDTLFFASGPVVVVSSTSRLLTVFVHLTCGCCSIPINRMYFRSWFILYYVVCLI